MKQPVRVVIADDSPFICRLLTTYLESTPDIKVVGTAHDGQEAIRVAEAVRPDVMTLDLQMPTMSGLEVLEQVMQDSPTPVIMVSGVSHQAATITLQALKLGAVDFVFKYTPGADTDPDILRQEIIDKVKAAARVKVIRLFRSTGRTGPLRARQQIKTGPLTAKPTGHLPDMMPPGAPLPGGVIVIGASTGGPVALRELLSTLPAELPAAVLIVQHIPASFTRVLAAQLDRHTPLRVREARPDDRLAAGRVLVAPGDYQLLVHPEGQIILNQGPPVNGHCPSVDVTMQSVAQVYKDKTTGVILTGMGEDGAAGISAIHAAGGKTFAQNEASCVINGMPQRAIERGVVHHVAPPADIGRLLGMTLAARRL